MSDPAAAPGVYVELPDLVRLKFHSSGFSFLPRQPVHSLLSGRHASRLRGRGLNFEEIRRYLPGDDIRNMDWRVTARLRKPHVRVYTEERDRSVLILVDQRAGMFFGSRRAMKSVVAAEIAALAAWRVLHAGDRVGGIVFSDSEETEFKPQRSESQVLRFLSTVVEKNRALHAGTGAPAIDQAARFTDVLARASRLAPHDCLVLLITDGAGASADGDRFGAAITAHNDMIVAFVHDPLEAELPSAGQLVMSDGARQLEVDTADHGLRRRFASEFEERLENLRALTRRRAVPLLPVDTEREVVAQLRELIGTAAEARR